MDTEQQVARINQAWNEERSHLVIEDDNGWPFLSGCDCEIARDHYWQQGQST